jgi:PAS domain S-box-containing protein
MLALLPPAAAAYTQFLLWPWLNPFAWFLFYPAIVFSSWIAGKWGGVLSTLLSAALVCTLFLPPNSFGANSFRTVVSAGIFIGMGVLLGFLNERLRQANRLLSEALECARATSAGLESAVQERTHELQESIDAARESHAKIDAALASMSDAVFISDTEGHFSEFNEAFATFHRFKDKAACAKNLSEYPDIIQVFFPNGEEAPLDMWAVPRALRGETAINAEYTIRRRDTGESWIGSYNFGPICDKDGAIVGSVVVGRDITERKREEDEIRRLNSKLEERIDDRTRQLEQANKELDSFSYSVSHDLRAPLRHINGYVELLMEDSEGQLPEKSMGYLNTIRSASNEMTQLIDDLLTFSRTGKIEMQERAFSVQDLLQEVLSAIEPEIAGRDVEWKIGQLPRVIADPSLLRQVLLNLVRNAAKYTSKRDHAEIEVGVAGQEEGRIVLFVRDNGVGFDMRYASKLFGVFQRLHSSAEFEGTGIGLAIVRSIVSRHGGRAWAEGVPDQGATFYFTLKPAL